METGTVNAKENGAERNEENIEMRKVGFCFVFLVVYHTPGSSQNKKLGRQTDESQPNFVQKIKLLSLLRDETRVF